MKLPYTLDYNIQRDTDRLAAVNDILDRMATKPTQSDLERMASYILYGKDEDGKNSIQRHETYDGGLKRYNSFRKKEDKNESLDALLENPMTNEAALQEVGGRDIYVKKKPTIRRPKYDANGNMTDPGDSDIPGMVELWEDIDRIQHEIAVAEGKIPGEDNRLTDYRLYQLRHVLIDMRRHQYYLRDAYKPEIHFLNIARPGKQTIDWSSDSYYWMTVPEWERKVAKCYLPWISRDLADYETREGEGGLEVKWIVRKHTFDWEDPKHIAALVDNYSAIYEELYDDTMSWGRTLIYDFDRYFDMCGFTPVREYILTRKIDKANHAVIAEEVQLKFGIKYNADRIGQIVHKEIPKKMAKFARSMRLLAEANTPTKRCLICEKKLPMDNLFFAHNRSTPDGFHRYCKKCERDKRIKKLGGDAKYDRRVKDSYLLKVQAEQATNPNELPENQK